jgi:hypothetical protein
VGVERELLEDHRYVTVARIGVGDVAIRYPHRSYIDLGQPGDAPEQCRLARAGWADDYEQFTVVDIEVDPVEHDGVSPAALPKGLANAAERNGHS